MRPRRIAVNTAIYLHGTSGSATATRSLVAALRHLEDVEICEVSPASRGGSWSVTNALRDASWDLRQASRVVPDADLLVSPCNVGLRGPARRHLLVVHDLMAIERPELFDRKFAAYYRLLVPRSVRSADRVLTLSESAATALRRMVPGVDVRVVTWAHPGSTSTRAAFPSRPVVLTVGAVEPVKNQVAGIRAVAELRRRTGADVGLRVLGPSGRAESDVRAALRAADPLGAWASREVDVPDQVIESAYASSWLLLQPSYDEGFGLPLVEAARHGLPVVHSGRGAMPSVLPDVNADSVAPDALATAMAPLLEAHRWSAESETVLKRSGAFTPEAFRTVVHQAVADLLPAV